MGVLIGRETAWVVDPFDRYRELLGPHAQELDDLATLEGARLAGLDDSSPEIRASELGQLLGALDPDQIADSLAWDRWVAEMEDGYRRATEDALILGARLRAGGDVHLEAEDDLYAAWDRAQSLEAELKIRVAQRADAGTFDLGRWVREHRQQVAKAIAVAREWDIRQERSHGHATGGPELPADRREIPGDLSAIQARRRAAEARELRMEPRELPDGWTLDVRGPVLSRYADYLDVVGRRLADWVAKQPDWWIEKRSDELGPPASDLDSSVAGRALRLEGLQQAAERERDQARRERFRFHRSDPERAEVARARAEKVERTIAELRNELQPVREQLDAWMSGRVVPALIYRDEAEFRRTRHIEAQVRFYVDSAPPDLVATIGAAPEPGTPLSERWLALADALARDEIVGEASRSARERQQLRTAIDQLRAERGMEPLEWASLGATSDSPGIEPF